MYYRLVKEVRELYECLGDELSQKIFWVRLALDADLSIENTMQILQLNPHFRQEQLEQLRTWKETLRRLRESGKKFVLYGTGGRGQELASALLRSGVEFYCFCGRRGPAGFPDGLMGKPVIGPDELFRCAEDVYVSICAGGRSYSEIERLLGEHGFPQDHILRFFECSTPQSMYFEFPEQYRPGTAFIDAGCYDCEDDYRFVDWSKGRYSSIFAFEPDPEQYAECERRLGCRSIRDIRMIQAGLANRPGTVEFVSKGAGGSRIVQESTDSWLGRGREQARISIQILALDDVVTEPVGFIKMDIEGAELSALQGAAGIITRDRPFLAISVYHKPGDTLAIMGYLHELVPEYRFSLRHYGPLFYETVLYAAVDWQN